MNYIKEAQEILSMLFRTEDMTDEQYNETLVKAEEKYGITDTKLSFQLTRGVANGHSIEYQIEQIEQSFTLPIKL